MILVHAGIGFKRSFENRHLAKSGGAKQTQTERGAEK
jgi:hypothetical protein